MEMKNLDAFHEFIYFMENKTDLYKFDFLGYPWYWAAHSCLKDTIPGAALRFQDEEVQKKRKQDFLSKQSLLTEKYDYIFLTKGKMRTNDPTKIELDQFQDILHYLDKLNKKFLIIEDPWDKEVDLKYLKSKFAHLILPSEFLVPVFLNEIQNEVGQAQTHYNEIIQTAFLKNKIPEKYKNLIENFKSIYLNLSGIISQILIKQKLFTIMEINAVFGGMGTHISSGIKNHYSVVEIDHGYHGMLRTINPFSKTVIDYFEQVFNLNKYFVLSMSAVKKLYDGEPMAFAENRFNYGLPELRNYNYDESQLNEIRKKYDLTGKKIIVVASSGWVKYSLLKKLIDSILETIPNVKILMRPHPSYENYKDHLSYGENVYFTLNENKYDLALIADVFISGLSSLVVEAYSVNKNIIVYPDKKFESKEYAGFLKKKYPFARVISLTDIDKFLLNIKELLEKPTKKKPISKSINYIKELNRLFSKIKIVSEKEIDLSFLEMPEESNYKFEQTKPETAHSQNHTVMIQDIPALVKKLAQREHPQNWYLLEDIFSISRRYLLQKGKSWRQGPERILQIAGKVYNKFSKFDSIKDKTYLDLGCGRFHPYGSSAFFYINGAAKTYALDDDLADKHRAAEALYDMLADALALPDFWHKKDISFEEYLRRIYKFNLSALKDGDLEEGIRNVPLHYLIDDASKSGLFEKNSIDLISSQAVLEHCTDLEKVLQNLIGWMGNNGLAYHLIDLIDHRYYENPTQYNQWHFLTNADAKGDGGVCNKIRYSEIIKMIRETGYTILEVDPVKKEIPAGLKDNLRNEYKNTSDDDLQITNLSICLQKDQSIANAVKNENPDKISFSDELNNKQHKVVIITEAFPALTETFILNQITGLIDRGIDLEIWTTLNLNEKQVQKDVDRYNLIEKIKYLKYPQNVTDGEKWVTQFLSINDIDYLKNISAFHVHFGPSFNRLAPLFNLNQNLFVMVSFHGYDASKYFREHGDKCYEFLFHRANIITTPSLYMKNILTEKGANSDKINVHHYGKNLKQFKPVLNKKNNKKLLFLSIARLVAKKGLEYSITAFAKIASKYDVEYKIIGEGPLCSELNNLISKLEMQEKIRIEPFKNSEAILRELRKTDVYVLTSVTSNDGDQEGIPVSLIEAHAVGLPVISTKHAGIPELVDHEKNGILCEEKNIGQIAAAFDELISNVRMRRKMSAYAVKKIKKEFNLDILNDTLFEYLKMKQSKADQRPFISIVIPTYNREQYIEQTIQSALEQEKSYQNFEILVVDDGSTDQTEEVVKNIISDRIRYIRKEHSCAPSTRNAGIKHAKGKYILWLDSDDVLLVDTVSNYVHLINQCPDAEIFYGDILITDEKMTPNRELKYLDWYGKNSELLAKMLTGNYVPNGGTLVEKSLYQKIGSFDESFIRAHDYEFYSRAVATAKFKHMDKFVLKWRWHDTNMSSESVSYDTSFEARITLSMFKKYNAKELFPYIPWKSISKDESNAIMFLNLANRFVVLKQFDLAEKFALQSSCNFDSKQAEELLKQIKNIRTETKSESPLVSVIIPTYNRPEYLKQAIDSVVNQDYKNFEILVVNDGSVDVTAILEDFKSSVPLYYFKHAENKGVSAARNTGIKNAKGKYIALLDDDDIFYPEHLSIAISHLNEQYPVVYTDSIRVTLKKDGNDYKKVSQSIPYSIDFDRNKLLVGNISPINCFVFSRDLAIETDSFDEQFRTLEDWDFWIRLSRKVEFLHIPVPTVQVNWRVDGTTLTTSHQADFQKSREIIYKRNAESIQKIPNLQQIMDEFKQIWSDDFANNAEMQIKEKKPDSASTEAIVSIIILTFNALEYTKKCIQSIQEYTKIPHEIIFVDNDSKDGTKKYLRQLLKKNQNYQLISNNKNMGFAAGNNQGAKKAKGKYLLLLNNDVEVSQGWLKSMVRVLELDEKIGMIGPITNQISGLQQVSQINYTDQNGFYQFARQVRQQNEGVITPRRRVAGFVVLMPKTLYDEIGGFDTSFGTGNYEDDDLCLRVREKGYAIMVDESTFIHHYGSRTFDENKINYKKSLKNKENIFSEKWPNVDHGELLEIKNPLFQEHELKIEKAFNLLADGEGEGALELFLSILIENPISGESLLGAAYCYRNLNDTNEALKYLQKLTELQPDNAIAYNQLGLISVESGDFENAKTFFIASIEKDSKYIDAQRNYAEILIQLEQYEEGIVAMNKILENHPEDVATMNSLAKLYLDANRENDAKKLVERTIVLDPENILTKKLAGELKLNLEVDSDEFTGLLEIGLQKLENGDLKQSLKVYQKILNKSPDNVTALYGSGLAYQLLGDHDLAKDMFSKVIIAAPTFADAYNSLGLILKQEGDFDGATDMYQKALEIDPANIDCQLNIADAFIESNKYEEGIQTIQLVLKNNPNEINALLRMGNLYLETENFEKANLCFDKVMEIDPNNEIAKQAMAMKPNS